MRARTVAGVDGCRAGWLCVAQNLRTGKCRATILARIEDLLRFDPAPAVIAIDMPIGLTDRGPRACELEARKLLGRPRSSSVFPAPVRPLLRASSWEQACRLGSRIDGQRINRETWNIMPKIREVDAFLRAHPEYRERIHETHPEVCFWRWSGGKGMTYAKKAAEGRAERKALVVSVFGSELEAASSILRRGGWAMDDLLDAFATLWTAKRVLAGAHVTLPPRPPVDRLGLRMEIVS